MPRQKQAKNTCRNHKIFASKGRKTMIEVCCGSFEDAMMASECGVKRVELNSEDELYEDLVEVYNNQMSEISLYVERDEKYYRDWVREIRSDGG